MKELAPADIQTLEWWTVREVANRFRVDGSTITRWIKAGKIKAMRIGNDWRIHASEVARLEKAGKPTVETPQNNEPDEWDVPNYI